MSRKKTEIDKNILETLKYQIKIKSGLECNTFNQISWLQQDIKKSVNENLSLQTLNRLFFLIKTSFNPSLNTLNVLSQYLRYSSFAEFSHLNSNRNNDKKHSSFELRFILALFSNINPNAESDLILQKVIKNTFKISKQDEKTFDGLYPSMAATPFGRKFFFEQYINMDGLDKEYGDGLKYYMLYADTKEQMLFATNLLCYRYFLTSDISSFSNYFKLINNYRVNDVMTFSPLLKGQYHATMIFAQYFGLRLDAGEINLNNVQTQSSFYERYFLAEALVLTNEFEHAWSLLNSGSTPSYSLYPSDDEELATQHDILWLISGFYSKRINFYRAMQIYSQVKDKPMKFLSEKLYTLFLLFLKRDLLYKTINLNEINSQILHLINETKFIHFHSYAKRTHEKYEKSLMDINGN